MLINSQPTRVLAAMSGGVDSAVCALLLKEAGFHVCGATGKMFGSNVFGNDEDGYEAFLDNVEDAKAVCRKLGIEHYTLNLKKPFEQHVIERFVDVYCNGLTPNPCVDCNRYIKFDEMQRKRAQMGFDYLATGHYAQVRYDESTKRWQLLRAKHTAKDQTYFLYNLTQEQLAHTLFPLGELSKEEVRAMAEAAGFANAQKQESQDICFIRDGAYADFIKDWLQKHEAEAAPCSEGPENNASLFTPGPIVDSTDKKLGKHTGLANYTIGQRKGIGIAAAEPLFVIGKNAQSNELIVGPRCELMVHDAFADDVNFIGLTPQDVTNSELRVTAKATYRQNPSPATLRFDGQIMHVQFDDAVMRPAPGQALVVYDEAAESVLAGGTICQAGNPV